MNSRKVTIAIPTLNRAEYLRLAVASALSQTYSNLEVIVSNNASTDYTAAILASFSAEPRLRVISQSVKLSMVDNWNTCVAASTGEYFLLLSDDDLLDKEAIAELVRSFEDGPLPIEEVGFVYCRGQAIDENGNVKYMGPFSPPFERVEDMVLEFFNSNRLPWACTILFRRSDISSGYTSRFQLSTDAAQWIQAGARHGHVVFVNRILASYRVHRNLSALTPVTTWQKENLALAEFAIEELRDSRSKNPNRYSEIRQATQRLNVRIVPSLLNQHYEGRKLKTLKAYLLHWRHLASLYGAYWTAKGLLQLYAPGFSLLLGRVRRLC